MSRICRAMSGPMPRTQFAAVGMYWRWAKAVTPSPGDMNVPSMRTRPLAAARSVADARSRANPAGACRDPADPVQPSPARPGADAVGAGGDRDAGRLGDTPVGDRGGCPQPRARYGRGSRTRQMPARHHAPSGCQLAKWAPEWIAIRCPVAPATGPGPPRLDPAETPHQCRYWERLPFAQVPEVGSSVTPAS